MRTPLPTFAYRRGKGRSTTQTGHSSRVDFEWQLHASRSMGEFDPERTFDPAPI